MQSKEWKKVKEVLEDVLPLSSKERENYFDESEIKSDIRKEVESLIAFENEAEDMLNLSAFAFTNDFYSDEEFAQNSVIGTNIGVYQVLRELGTGGMGAVFLAKRTDGEFNREVAIKMLRREFNTSEIRKRFEQEKEIQAALIHPNIARLIDAGTTTDGIPYIVMEYIEGETIGNYCRKQGLVLKEQLKLFNKICDAVAFAHRNLVIHRDLKPSNIIITKDGEPKLLDFGISKLLSGETTQAQTVTKLGVMTPEYASPEQVKGKSVTTATDIYSLGVILFELLTGERPFDAEFRETGNIFTAILEKEPGKPSDVLSRSRSTEIPKLKKVETTPDSDNTDDEARTQVLDDVQTQELILKTKPQFVITNPKDLAGDIDNIILKSLRKEPERRYGTVEQFSSDIWKYLDGMPVSARPSTFGYRASKFIKRNKAGVAAGVLVLLAVIIGLIATLWQAEVARAERLKAENRFNDVRGLANSFLFEITPEIEKLNGSTRAKVLLVKRALEYLDRLSKESSDDPDLKGELAAAYEKVGDVQGNPFQANIGDMQGALNSYQKARKIREELFSGNSQDLKLKAELAKNTQMIGDVLFATGEIKKAEENYRRALKMLMEVAEEKPSDRQTRFDLASARFALGGSLFWNSRYEEALKQYYRAKESLEKLSKAEPENIEIVEKLANSYVRIGETKSWQDKADEAKTDILKGLSMLELLVEKKRNNANFKKSLWTANLKAGEIYLDLEQLENSLIYYEKALEIAKETAENDPENVFAKRNLALSYNKVGDTLDSSGKGNEAFNNAQKALNLQKEIAAADAKNFDILTEIVVTYLRMGYAKLTAKDHLAARQSFLNALEQSENLSAKDPDDSKIKRNIAIASQNIGQTYHAAAGQENKKENLQKALVWLEKSRKLFLDLKKKGLLAEYDNKLLTEIETEISNIIRKIG